MPSLDRLERLLTQAADALDEATRQIRELELHPDINLDRIGQALVHVLDVQDEIYSLRPDLVRDETRERPEDMTERPKGE